ncbi:MAG TPA: hypothetical protein DCM08_14485 [Microscillaceae bacterium]|nr:hypothetical protein [Microscillaceae bacterium]
MQKTTLQKHKKYYLLCISLAITFFWGWKAHQQFNLTKKTILETPSWSAPEEFLGTILQRESFDPELFSIQTIDAAHQYLEKKAAQMGIPTQQNVKFVEQVDQFVKQRFFHAYATYSAQDHCSNG